MASCRTQKTVLSRNPIEKAGDVLALPAVGFGDAFGKLCALLGCHACIELAGHRSLIQLFGKLTLLCSIERLEQLEDLCLRSGHNGPLI